MNWTKGVARAGIAGTVGVVALLSVLFTGDRAAAGPVPPADRRRARVDCGEPTRDTRAGRQHGGRPTGPAVAQPAQIPLSRPVSGSADADADGADGDRAPTAALPPRVSPAG